MLNGIEEKFVIFIMDALINNSTFFECTKAIEWLININWNSNMQKVIKVILNMYYV